MSVSVSLFVCFVCMSARISRKPLGQTSKFVFLHVAYGRDTVLFGWRCDMLCTSGFVDDVTFSHNGLMSRRRIYDRHNGRDSNQILLNVTIKTSKYSSWVAGAKSAISDCLVVYPCCFCAVTRFCSELAADWRRSEQTAWAAAVHWGMRATPEWRWQSVSSNPTERWNSATNRPRSLSFPFTSSSFLCPSTRRNYVDVVGRRWIGT